MIKDNIIFLREFIAEFQNTGTCFPTSKKAACALSEPLKGPRTPRRILELGPGTGSVTFPIIQRMIPGDELAICEINPRFMRELKAKLEKDPLYQQVKDQVRFFEGPIQDFPEDWGKWDVIVCSLPFLNFDLHVVEEIFEKLQRLSTAKTVMTYYQYMGLRSLGRTIGSKEKKAQMLRLDTFFDSTLERYLAHRKRVWFNMLPINVYTLEIAA